MDFYDFFFFSATFAFFGLWTPVSLVFWWRNMTVYSSPYKVGLIYAGTKFAQSWLVIGSLNFLVTLCSLKAKLRSLCKHCTTSISPSNNPMWHKVCGFFLYFRRLDFRFGPFVFFRFSIRLLIWFRIRLQKLWRLGIDKVSIASRQISLRTVWGTLVCFIRGVKVLWTHVTLLGLARTSNSKKRTPSINRLLNFCKQPTQFNKKHLIWCVVCVVFSFTLKLNL